MKRLFGVLFLLSVTLFSSCSINNNENEEVLYFEKELTNFNYNFENMNYMEKGVAGDFFKDDVSTSESLIKEELDEFLKIITGSRWFLNTSKDEEEKYFYPRIYFFNTNYVQDEILGTIYSKYLYIYDCYGYVNKAYIKNDNNKEDLSGYYLRIKSSLVEDLDSDDQSLIFYNSIDIRFNDSSSYLKFYNYMITKIGFQD